MSITVELSYDLAKAAGARSFQVDGAATVQDAVRLTRDRFGNKAGEFDSLTRFTSLVLNGVLLQHRNGQATPLADGDRLSFLKVAAGG
jgi:molybdopterin converting factor small subunit